VLHDRLATAKCKIGTKIAMTISEFLKVLSEILKNEACHHIYIHQFANMLAISERKMLVPISETKMPDYNSFMSKYLQVQILIENKIVKTKCCMTHWIQQLYAYRRPQKKFEVRKS